MKTLVSIARLIITYLALNILVLEPRNPRKHSARQIRQIARSIETFGFAVPILIDRNNKIVCGHGRYFAAQFLGLTEVPVIRLEHLTEAQAQAFQIADNRLTETSTWDDRLLAESLKELSELDLDFSLEATGFTIGEIDLQIESLATESTEADEADTLPPLAMQPISRLGDLWLLRKHRLYCGSALDSRAYEALLQGERATTVITDPPFNVRIDGHASGLGAIHHREFLMASGEMTTGQYAGFLLTALTLLVMHSIEGSIHFIFIDWRHLFELLSAGRQAYTELKNLCVWNKGNGGMGSLYRSQHELILVFKHGTGPHRNNVQLGKYGRNRTNVWNYPCANTFSRQSDEGHLAVLHPTVKPVRMIADAILDCSARGDLVLDPFLGSGTTLIAAERVGRTCYGMDLDPLYVDTAIRRWQVYTGDHAIDAATGKRFDDLTAQIKVAHD
jgi:ParB-like chromosome segregation protein Spo0J